jgi:hypothetical protein
MTVRCTCAQPIPGERATRKGAATTECARCGLPVRLTLARSAAA